MKIYLLPHNTKLMFSKFISSNCGAKSVYAKLCYANSQRVLTCAEPAAVYEIQLVAFNGNGDGPSNRRLVSLTEGAKTAAGRTPEDL